MYSKYSGPIIYWPNGLMVRPMTQWPHGIDLMAPWSNSPMI